MSAHPLPQGIRFARLSARSGSTESPSPGLFLDRDGVLVEETGYLHRVEDVRLLPGAAEIAFAANSAGIPAIAISNQSGVARGMYGWEDYELVEAEIARQLEGLAAQIDARIACGTHSNFTSNWGADHARWRKPGPAMFQYVAAELELDLARSWMVGDVATDVEAAAAAGLAGCIHVLTGHGARQREIALSAAGPDFTVLPAAGLEEARELLAARGLLR